MKNNLLIKALSLFLVLSSSAFAQVDYVRSIDLSGTFSSTILAASQSPITGDGYRVPDAFSEYDYAALDVNTGTVGRPVAYPDFFNTAASVFAWVGQSSTGAYAISVTNRRITVYSIEAKESRVSRPLSNLGVPPYFTAYSVAAQSLESPVSLLTDKTHYTVDPATGVVTAMPLSGLDTATTRFMAYGADGLLYVLDYGHSRIAAFDPDNAFAPISSFTLEFQPGTTVANEQFAIGATGSFYLADGLGGGSYYNSLGQYQDVFTLPGDAVLNPYTGASFINTDAEGNILVYDSAKGLHQYRDLGVVPEPATWALIGLSTLALLFRRRVICSR